MVSKQEITFEDYAGFLFARSICWCWWRAGEELKRIMLEPKVTITSQSLLKPKREFVHNYFSTIMQVII